MAFKAFGNEQAQGSQALPWSEEYLHEHPEALRSCHDVFSIKLTQKGMTFACDVCKAFVYKGSDDYKHVLEFIETWHAAKQKSPVLQMMLVDYRPHAVLGVDDERHAYWGKQADNSWTQAYATAKDNIKHAKSSNPLPMPASTPSTCQHDATHHVDASQVATTTQELAEMPLAEPTSPANGHKRTKVSKHS